MRAVNDNLAAPHSSFLGRKEQSAQFWIQPGPLVRGEASLLGRTICRQCSI